MFYAKLHAYGTHVINENGTRADKIYQFTRRNLRDLWVADDEAKRSVCDSKTAKRADYRIDGDAEGWRVLAAQRVNDTPAFRPYRDLLVHYDWGDNDHWKWVATETEREILSWAKDIAERQADNA